MPDQAEPSFDPPPEPDPDEAGLADGRAEAKVAWHLRMRALGVQDRHVLRAFELVPRAHFVASRLGALAARDVALPIACGQTMAAPGLAALMIEALTVQRGHRVLEIGSGSGFATAILAHLADAVLGLERFGSLAATAQDRLEARGIANAAVVWADGLAGATLDSGAFDRVIVHGLLDGVPASLADRLSDDAVVVCARRDGDAQGIVRLSGRDLSVERPICACRLQAMRSGLATTL